MGYCYINNFLCLRTGYNAKIVTSIVHQLHLDFAISEKREIKIEFRER